MVIRYLAEHEAELGNFPTLKGKSTAEIEEALLKALDAGRSDPLAYRKHPDKPGSKILDPDWNKRNADEPDRTVNRLCKAKLDAMRKFYGDHPDTPRRAENLEGIDKLEEELELSQKGRSGHTENPPPPDPHHHHRRRSHTRCRFAGKEKRMMKLKLIRHADCAGETMDRVEMLDPWVRTKHAVVSAMVELGAIRVSVFEKKGKATRKPKKGAAGGSDDFKNVSVRTPSPGLRITRSLLISTDGVRRSSSTFSRSTGRSTAGRTARPSPRCTWTSPGSWDRRRRPTIRRRTAQSERPTKRRATTTTTTNSTPRWARWTCQSPSGRAPTASSAPTPPRDRTRIVMVLRLYCIEHLNARLLCGAVEVRLSDPVGS